MCYLWNTDILITVFMSDTLGTCNTQVTVLCWDTSWARGDTWEHGRVISINFKSFSRIKYLLPFQKYLSKSVIQNMCMCKNEWNAPLVDNASDRSRNLNIQWLQHRFAQPKKFTVSPNLSVSPFFFRIVVSSICVSLAVSVSMLHGLPQRIPFLRIKTT